MYGYGCAPLVAVVRVQCSRVGSLTFVWLSSCQACMQVPLPTEPLGWCVLVSYSSAVSARTAQLPRKFHAPTGQHYRGDPTSYFVNSVTFFTLGRQSAGSLAEGPAQLVPTLRVRLAWP